jgi:hypothetical protein
MHINEPISDPTKCLARPEVACAQLGTTGFGCLPLCGSDSQCPTGTHCDWRASVCVSTPHAGLPSGKVCSVADGGADPCAGVCLSLGPSGDAGTVSVCSQECVLGDDPATASTPIAWTACGGIKNGLCAYLGSNEGAGDLGYCANGCNKQDDCDNPGFWCYAITNLTGANGVTNGWCFGGSPCATTADCTSWFPGSTCESTAYGLQCLSSQFPLGSAAPDAGPG